MILFILFSLFISNQEDEPKTEAAKAAIQQLAEKYRDAKTLSARFVQSRRTALLDKPITSSGTLFYRREPSRLVLHIVKPRPTEIHLEKSSYQVFRPDEKRLEQIDFGKDEAPSRLLMIFQPKTDEIGKTFTIRKGKDEPGKLVIVLDPSNEKVRRHLTRLVLTLHAPDATLQRIVYTDAEGDEVCFDLSDVTINPKIPPATFELKVPEGTRIMKHSIKAKI